MSVSFCLPHPVAVSAFMICRGLCACTEMLWVCVLYVSFGSKVRPRTFGCIAMGSALLFIVRSRLLVYSAGSGVNRVQVVLSGFSKRLFCFVQTKTLCRYGCMYFLAALVLNFSLHIGVVTVRKLLGYVFITILVLWLERATDHIWFY